MNCWHCNNDLIWGGDDYEEGEEGTTYIVTNLSCPECKSSVLVYYPIPDDQGVKNV